MSFKFKSYEAAKAAAQARPSKPRKPMSRGKGIKRGGKRLRAKRDPKLVAWGKAVLERDGWQCQVFRFNGMGAYWLTSSPCFGPLDPHHIAERSLRPDLKYDVDNGITMCRTHHDLIPLNRQDAIRIGLLSDKTYEAAMKEQR